MMLFYSCYLINHNFHIKGPRFNVVLRHSVHLREQIRKAPIPSNPPPPHHPTPSEMTAKLEIKSIAKTEPEYQKIHI